MNAHHPDWDKRYKASYGEGIRRGTAVRAWVEGAGSRILNNGEPTRMQGSSATAPDLTIVPQRFKDARWSILPCAGSDHDALMTDLPLQADPIRRPGRGRQRWAFGRADWPAFTARCDELLDEVDALGPDVSTHHLNDRFTQALLTAAKETIPAGGGGRPGQVNKPWWSPEIAELVRLRQEARRTAKRTGAREDITRWHQLRDTSKRAINKAKEAEWQDFASSLSMRT
eukprot:gene57036-biopygen50019